MIFRRDLSLGVHMFYDKCVFRYFDRQRVFAALALDNDVGFAFVAF